MRSTKSLLSLMVAATLSASFVIAQAEVKRFTLDRPHPTTFSQFSKFMNDRNGITISIDQEAFTKAGIKDPIAEKRINTGRLIQAHPNLVVEILAQQVGGQARWDKDKSSYVIVPGKRSLASALPPPTDRLKKDVEKQIDKNSSAKVPLKDLIEFFVDRSDLMILIDEVAFPKVKDKKIEEAIIDLPAGAKSLKDWVAEIAKQVNGEVVFRDNVILISYRSNSKS